MATINVGLAGSAFGTLFGAADGAAVASNTPAAGAAILCGCNLHDRYGAYHAWDVVDGELRHRRAAYSIPAYELSHFILGGTDDAEPAAAELPSGRLLLLFSRDGDAVETYTDDDGDHWKDPPDVAIAGGSHAEVAVSRDGLVIRAAYDGGLIAATLQEPGEEDPGATFTFEDDGGVDLSVEDDAFGLSFAPDAPGRLLLHVLLSGASDTSDFYSTDQGRTWTLIT